MNNFESTEQIASPATPAIGTSNKMLADSGAYGGPASPPKESAKIVGTEFGEMAARGPEGQKVAKASSLEERLNGLATEAAISLDQRQPDPKAIETGLNREMSRISEVTHGKGSMVGELVELEAKSLMEKGSMIGTFGGVSPKRGELAMPEVNLQRDDNYKVTGIDFHSATDPYKSISCAPNENKLWSCSNTSTGK